MSLKDWSFWNRNGTALSPSEIIEKGKKNKNEKEKESHNKKYKAGGRYKGPKLSFFAVKIRYPTPLRCKELSRVLVSSIKENISVPENIPCFISVWLELLSSGNCSGSLVPFHMLIPPWRLNCFCHLHSLLDPACSLVVLTVQLATEIEKNGPRKF